MKKSYKLTICALCIAIGCILPTFFHMFGMGTAFSPLHFPSLLCGLICGPWYGLACGVLNPILCSLFTAMPPVARLGYLVPEIACYGLFSGLFFRLVQRRRHSFAADAGEASAKMLTRHLYIALIGALLIGKIVGGIFRAILFTGGTYTVALWATTFFVESLPGIVVQLITIPLIYLALKKAKAIK